MVPRTRILIVDDHPISREGLSIASRAALPGTAVTGVGTIAEAEGAMAATRFRLILLDYRLPDAHGYSGLLRLQHCDGSVPIVVVTGREDQPLIEAARVLGAAGYVFKSTPVDDLVAILRKVVAGGSWFPSDSPAPNASIANMRRRIADLSRAQQRVLMALSDGRSNKQIAYDLDVSEATVKAHLTAVFRRIGVTNRTQALIAVGPILEPDKEPE